MRVRTLARSFSLTAYKHRRDPCHRVELSLRRGQKPSIQLFTRAMLAHGQRGQWQKSMELLQTIHEIGHPVDRIMYNSALRSLGKCGRYKEALSLLDYMERIGGDCEPDVVTYSLVISACGRTFPSQWETALNMLVRMRERKIQIDMICFNSVVDACAKAGEIAVVKKLLDEIRGNQINTAVYESPRKRYLKKTKSVQYGAANDIELRPSVVTFTMAISSCVKSGDWLAALQIYDEVKKSEIVPNLVFYNTLLAVFKKSFIENSDSVALERFELVVNDLKTSGIEIDTILTCNIMDAYCNYGKYEIVWAIYTAWRDKNVRTNEL